jgi:phosphoserine phosphatase
MRKNNELMDAYSQGNLAMEDYMAFSLEPMIGRTRRKSSTWSALGRRLYRTDHLQRRHQNHRRHRAGDRILVISASGTHLVTPIAARLGIDEYSASNWRWPRRVQRPTVGVLTYREGKITRLLEWLEREGETWKARVSIPIRAMTCRCC